jgi:integrase
MKGTTIKRGRTWTAVLDLGPRTAQRCDTCPGWRGRAGKVFWPDPKPLAGCPDCGGELVTVTIRRREWESGFATKRAAQDWLNRALSRVGDGSFVEPSKLTTGEYLNRWLEGQRDDIRPTTWDSYRRNLAGHVVPSLGLIPLQKLSTADLDRLYAELLRGNGHKPLSLRTVRYIHSIAHKALSDAKRKGLVVVNVADEADPPASKMVKAAAKAKRKIWNAEELRAFLEFVSEDRLYPAWFLGATKGLRRGEILGLRWKEDVDLEAAELRIQQALTAVGYKIVTTEPKTHRSERPVPLDPASVTVLRAWRKRQAEERLAAGEAWQDSGLVFTDGLGRPLHPDEFSKTFQRHVRASGLRRIRLHDLRHSYATAALSAGMPAKVLSQILGHVSVAFTLDVYAIPTADDEREAAERVASLIFGGSR